jgi:CHAD domain-containing protein
MAKTAKSTTRSPEAHPDTFPLMGRIDELVEGLRQHVPSALKDFDEEAVHDARVATRRLKAALDLLEPVLSKGGRKPFARVLKRLRKRLGPLRDLDVMLGHLDEFSKSPRYAIAAKWLAERLLLCRQDERKRAGRKSSVVRTLGRLGAWWGLREEVAEAGEAVGSLLAESVHLQLDAFAEQADRIACHVRGGGAGTPIAHEPSTAGADASQPPAPAAPAQTRSIDGAAANELPRPSPDLRRIEVPADSAASPGGARKVSADADDGDDAADAADATPPAASDRLDPHELRIAGKALRYTLEMAAIEGHKLPPGLTKAFKAMQESLGLWHDYVVLTEAAMRTMLGDLLPHHDAGLSADVLELTRGALQRSARELQKFSSLWLERGETLTRTIRTAFPLTRSLQDGQTMAADATGVTGAGEPKTGPGPCDSESPADSAAQPPGEPSAA